jgi:hypothetical protein
VKEEDAMAGQEPLTRRYQMLCQRCERGWETVYEIRTLHDDAGDHQLFYRDGAPAAGPVTMRCPYCGGLRVRVLPRHVAV